MTASTTDDHAYAERRIQELTKELSQARDELIGAREQQTTTAEILRLISTSPTDFAGLFSAIARTAARLCDAYDVVIQRFDGESSRIVAHHGPIPGSPMQLVRGTPAGRAVIERRAIHVADLQAKSDEYPEASAPGALAFVQYLQSL